MSKKRIITSIAKLPPVILELFQEEYADGYISDAQKINKGNGDFFYAVPLETDEISYLIKVDMKIDQQADEDDDNFIDEDESETKMVQFDESEHDLADD